MQFTETTTAVDKHVLFNDHYVTTAYNCAALTALATDGVIPAGTVVPANDATAKGVLLHSVNLNKDPNGAVIIHGFLLGSNLPAEISAAAKTALPMIAVM